MLALNEEVGQELINRQQRITSAESLTAGLFVSRLAEVSGISSVLPGAFVTYSAAAKEQLVQVEPALIERYGVVSAPVAAAMAKGAKKALDTDWAISFTGVAGPASLEGKPAGTVFIGLAKPDGQLDTKALLLTGDRQAIRSAAVEAGFDFIKAALAEEK